MRSCVSVVVLGACLVAAAQVSAQTPQVRTLYEQARVRESRLRQDLDSPAAGPALLTGIRTLVTTFDDLARLFPASGYSDNALWQGATLAADAYWQFGESRDRDAAIRLYQSLTARFPTSSLVPRVPGPLARLTAGRPRAPRVEPTAQKPALVPAPVPNAGVTQADVRLTSVTRDAMPDVLRVSVALEREVAFTVERLDGPPRVFLDFQSTKAADTLKDLVLPIDNDVVKQVRIGRQPGSRTRVVFDLRAPVAHSVFTLYDPYRVVIDFARARPVARAAASLEPVTPPVASRRIPVAAMVLAPSMAPSIAPPPVATISAAPVQPPPVAGPTTAAESAPPTTRSATTPSANLGGRFSLSRQLGLGATRIAIDPGHGGHDPGAKARGLTEADLVLSVALKLEKLLLNQPGTEVILTRRTNAYVSLEERTAIANRAGADLFLSIHANASANPAAQGIETYFLNFASSDAAEAVAARENVSSARSMRDLQDIVRAIALNNKVDESRDLARLVQASLHQRLRETSSDVKNLGVKQAPFMVLIGATMPSVLAEVSFITNAKEASRLKTEKYRQHIADALLAAILRYRQALKTEPALATR